MFRTHPIWPALTSFRLTLQLLAQSETFYSCTAQATSPMTARGPARGPRSPSMAARDAALGPGLTLGRAQLSDPRPLRRSSTQPPSRRSIALDQRLTRTPDIGRKPRALPAIASQPSLPHTPSRVRLRTAINAPPPWSQPNVSIKHERAGSPTLRIAFMRRPETAPAAPLPSPGAYEHRAVLTEQQKWRFKDGDSKAGAQSLMHEFPLLSEALALKAAGCRVRQLLMRGYDVSTLRQAGYSAEEFKNEVSPPPPSHVLCVAHHQRLHHLLHSTLHLLRPPPPSSQPVPFPSRTSMLRNSGARAIRFQS